MLKIGRRRFLQALGQATVISALGATAARSAGQRYGDLPLAFSTMGCPKWDWTTILDQAAKFGYRGVELRGIQGETDLTRRPEFSPPRLKRSLEEAQARRVLILNLCASTNLHEPDGVKRAKQLDEAKRFIDLARQLKAPYVRVFPNSYVKGEPKSATIDRIIAGLGDLGRHAKGSGVAVLLESHGDFTNAASLLEIMRGAEMPEVGLLWDTEHTFAKGGEQPSDTFRHLHGYIKLAQLRDSVRTEKGVKYVLAGAGTVPLREIVRVLMDGGYRGYYSFDWPKLWNPELAEPEAALPQFAQFMRELLKSKASLNP